MNAITTAEMTRIRAATADTMWDTCKLGTATETHGTTYDTENISFGSAIACGFKAGGGREANNGSQVPVNAASVRLPLTTTITSIDRVQLISRFGYTLGTPETYAVNGGPEFGPTAITLRLTRQPAGGVG